MGVGDEIRQLAQSGTDEALRQVGDELLRHVIPDVPPTDPKDDPDPGRALRHEGFVHVEDGGQAIVVGFRGPYAAKQDLAQSFEHPRGGHALFLETNFKALLPKLPELVGAVIRHRLTGRRNYPTRLG